MHMILITKKLLFCSLFILLQITNLRAQNTDSLLQHYILNYKEKYDCCEGKCLIPRFSDIDSHLFYKIESEFSRKDFHLLYLLIVPIKYNHAIYVNKFKQDYIIDDGLVCQENSIIKLIRIAMHDSTFIVSKASQCIEDTGDILYWVNLNRNRIVNYQKIDVYLKKIQNKRGKHRKSEAVYMKQKE